MKRRFLVLSSLGAGAVVLSLASKLLARGEGSQATRYPEPPLSPEAFGQMPVSFQQAYLYAKAHPAVLGQFPCYCGCGKSVGHKSNRDCFLFADGVYNSHGSRCDTCVDVALTAERNARAGISVQESIRQLNLKYRDAPRMPGFKS